MLGTWGRGVTSSSHPALWKLLELRPWAQPRGTAVAPLWDVLGLEEAASCPRSGIRVSYMGSKSRAFQSRGWGEHNALHCRPPLGSTLSRVKMSSFFFLPLGTFLGGIFKKCTISVRPLKRNRTSFI